MKTRFWISALAVPFIFTACDAKKTVSEKMEAGKDKISEGVKEMAGAAKETATEKIDKAREDAKAAIDKAEGKIDDATVAAKAKMEKASDAAGAAVESAKAKLNEAAGEVKESVQEPK